MSPKIAKQTKRISLLGSALLVTAGILLWAGFNAALEATNTTEFCISCHEMEATVYQDYRESVHTSNPSGVRAECADCHVPKAFWPKIVRKLEASRELYHWLAGTIDTREKFDARRPLLIQREWQRMRDSDSQTCRSCHVFDSMDLAGQARFAARIHGEGLVSGKTCIDCHQGIAHQLPQPDPIEAVALPRAEREELLEYGAEINETCAGCHGEYAEGSIDGEYPRLAGMSLDYLSRQLNLFKQRDRLNIPMVPYTNDRELPADDIQAVAYYISQIKLPTKLPALEQDIAADGSFDALGRLEASNAVVNIARYPGNIDAGSRVWRKECATCHGIRGEGNSDGTIPPLTGQHSTYIKRQVDNFRHGERLHDAPGDAEIFNRFGDSEIDDILAFLSVQDD